MTLNRPVPVVLGLSALYGATFVVVRWLCEGTPFKFFGYGDLTTYNPSGKPTNQENNS